MTKADFEHLIQQLSRKLFGFAFRILRNQEDAEDVVQEIFIRLWNMGDKLNQYKSIEALAITITKNYCIDLLRKQKHNFRSDFNIAEQTTLESSSLYEQMENRESYEIINNIIDSLPEAYKVIIRLRDIDGREYEEIAEKTGQNINTLRVTLSRARKLIRDEYKNYQYERSGIKQVDRKVL